MLKKGLEFAQGTTDECKRLVGRLFTPTELYGAYKEGRHHLHTGDLVLVVSESDPSGVNVKTRNEFVRQMKEDNAGNPIPFFAHALIDKSAHGVVSLPFESDAFWLVIARRQEIPVMVVIYMTPYEVAVGGEEITDQSAIFAVN
jgi:hypothetical protein